MKKLYATLIFTLFTILSLLATVSAADPVFVGLDAAYAVVQGETLTIPLSAVNPDGSAIDHFEFSPENFGSILNPAVNPTIYQLVTLASQSGTFTVEFTVYGATSKTEEQVTIDIIETDADLASQVSAFTDLGAYFVDVRDNVAEFEAELVTMCNNYQTAGDAGDSAAVADIQEEIQAVQDRLEVENENLEDLQTAINDLTSEVEALPGSTTEQNALLVNLNTLMGLADNLWVPLAEALDQAETYCGISFNPVLTATSLPNAQEGVAYTFTITATDVDGNLPVTFNFTGSVLPNGITANPSTGVISGTPALGAVGSYAISVQPIDSNGNEGATASLTLVVLQQEVGGNPPTITTTSLPNAVEGVGYSVTLAAQDSDAGDTIHFNFTGSVLPAGLSANPETGVISGTPQVNTANGNYHVDVFPVDNHDNQGAAVTFQLVVNDQSALLPQYQQTFNDYEDLWDQYKDDLIDIDDDIEEECDNYKAAVQRNDDDAADDAEEELDDIEDDDLEPFEDNVKTLENNVEDLLDAVENVPNSNTQSDLENDVEDLLDDVRALLDDVDNSANDIDNFCPSTTVATPTNTPTASRPVQTATQTQPVQQAREVVSVMTTPAFSQQQVPVQVPVVEEKQGLSVLTLFILSMVGLVLFLALLVFIFIMVR